MYGGKQRAAEKELKRYALNGKREQIIITEEMKRRIEHNKREALVRKEPREEEVIISVYAIREAMREILEKNTKEVL